MAFIPGQPLRIECLKQGSIEERLQRPDNIHHLKRADLIRGSVDEIGSLPRDRRDDKSRPQFLCFLIDGLHADVRVKRHELPYLIFENQPLVYSHLVPDDDPVRILPHRAGKSQEKDQPAQYARKPHNSTSMTCPGSRLAFRDPSRWFSISPDKRSIGAGLPGGNVREKG